MLILLNVLHDECEDGVQFLAEVMRESSVLDHVKETCERRGSELFCFVCSCLQQELEEVWDDLVQRHALSLENQSEGLEDSLLREDVTRVLEHLVETFKSIFDWRLDCSTPKPIEKLPIKLGGANLS
jgi:hypothetical protein